MEYILVQVVAFLFGFSNGLHDVPAVDNFTFYGLHKKEKQQQALFHGANFVLKSCFVAVIPVLNFSIDGGLLAGCAFLIIWGVFDPVIALFRTVYTPPKKPWYYLSTGNKTDAFLLKIFGAKAGLYKAGFCLLSLIALNLLLFL